MKSLSTKSEKIRVLNVLHSFGRGGAEKLLLCLMTKYDMENFDWAVCGLTEPFRESLLPKFRQKNIRCYDVNISAWNFKRNPFKAFVNICKIIYLFRKIYKDYKPDVIHTHLFWPGILVQMLFAYSNTALVATYHNIVQPCGLKGFAMKLGVKIAKPLCIACSEAVKEVNIASGKIPKELCVVVPTGVDINEYNRQAIKVEARNAFEDSPTAIHILQIGSLESRKGYKYTIEALSLLKQKGISALVCAVGMGAGKTDFENLAREKQVSNSIMFLGGVPDDEKKKLLQNADIYVMPSLYEGLSQAMLEAMSMELPVIASAVGGAPEVIQNGKNGFLIPSANSQALADKIEVLASCSQLRKNMGKEARRTVAESYSLEKQAQVLEGLYRKVYMAKRERKTRFN